MKSLRNLIIINFILIIFHCNLTYSQGNQQKRIIAYWHGDAKEVEKYHIKKITHLIYCFLHLDGNILKANDHDKIHFKELIKLKKINPDLKILISLGGWGGCETCSDIFSTKKARTQFSNSVLSILSKYNLDGIDLDWEYPALPSLPGHSYSSEDKHNFTLLIEKLRKTIGKKYTISFAAGGFEEFLMKSVEWEKIMPLIDFVNLMNYDIINGNSTYTGHHTPLFSNKFQNESTQFTVNFLIDKKIPKEKIVIGAAFYGRIFENVDSINNGLYRPGKFNAYVNFKDLDKVVNKENGFDFYYDSISKAAWAYNKSQKLFATYDDKFSVKNKANYVMDENLGGIMFWSLNGDYYDNGLLDIIYNILEKKN
jgi:chitinase